MSRQCLHYSFFTVESRQQQTTNLKRECTMSRISIDDITELLSRDRGDLLGKESSEDLQWIMDGWKSGGRRESEPLYWTALKYRRARWGQKPLITHCLVSNHLDIEQSDRWFFILNPQCQSNTYEWF